jgi:hypothetical protein
MFKTSSLKASFEPKISQLTMDFKAIIILFKFDPSSFTYTIVFALKHTSPILLSNQGQCLTICFCCFK